MTPATAAQDDITLRVAQPADRDAILQFVETMGFNPRDAVTWDALQMTAMTAWRRDRLVGAIPMEPRMFQMRPGLVVPTLHQTVVAMHPDERGKGVGSQMQAAIVRKLNDFGSSTDGAPPELITVFREEPESPAYRWYCGNGFAPAMHVDSWFLEQTVPPRDPSPPSHQSEIDVDELADLWRANWGEPVGGFVYRPSRPLKQWLAVHPYRSRYRFTALRVVDSVGLAAGYALLGIGKLHSDSIRADILDLGALTADRRHQVLESVIATARENKWRPIRWPMATGDAQAIESAVSLGFEKKWGFDLLVKSTPAATPRTLESLARDTPRWRYASIDYI